MRTYDYDPNLSLIQLETLSLLQVFIRMNFPPEQLPACLRAGRDFSGTPLLYPVIKSPFPLNKSSLCIWLCSSPCTYMPKLYVPNELFYQTASIQVNNFPESHRIIFAKTLTSDLS